jgi:predicted nicotinamide N-methyase
MSTHPFCLGIFFLCRLVADRVINLENESLLEIGCGTGLASIVCCLVGGIRSVVMTDYNPRILQVVQQNIDFNGCSEKARVECLDWFNIEASNLRHQKFHKIIGADLIYDVSHAEAVPKVLAHFLEKSPTAAIYIVLASKHVTFLVVCKQLTLLVGSTTAHTHTHTHTGAEYRTGVPQFEQNMKAVGFEMKTQKLTPDEKLHIFYTFTWKL